MHDVIAALIAFTMTITVLVVIAALTAVPWALGIAYMLGWL